MRSEQTLITKMNKDGVIINTQEDIMNHVTEFYSSLYDEKSTLENYDDLFSELPTLDETDRADLDKEITLEELRSTLEQCKDTAPGPDGISYKIYKVLWGQVGKFLLDAWNYSITTTLLPEDQRTSCITLLPKQGKDLEKIENWRPITLTNCDLKIFTKLISDRVSTKLDKLISTSQTAYIPGRVVHDNLRMFEFYKDYCKQNNVEALLISLDAKKAFDSVSHKYLHEVLRRYGFSDSFIETIKLLYKDIKANILVNGYKSVMIKIARSVKQGDALSCALFILCIDPLLRKIESNDKIKPVPIPRSEITNIAVNSKVGAFADDVGLAVKKDSDTLTEIFNEYALFSRLSGIELNVDKTEILQMNVNSNIIPFTPEVMRVDNVDIRTSESIKICGIVFSNNESIAYKGNISDKIKKLEQQLIRWLPRGLSVEGKLLIVKTFGISQLIYSLQICDINEREIKNIESIIFRFLWNKKWSNNVAPDRIKRTIMKLPHSKGGLKAPDIKTLNAALKTKQFLRAANSNHTIRNIQLYLLEEKGYYEHFKLEYSNICNLDSVTKTFQATINCLTDSIRQNKGAEEYINPNLDVVRRDIIASTDVLEYLHRKKMQLVIYRFSMLYNRGIETFKELVNELRFPASDRTKECAADTLKYFPNQWITLVEEGEEINSNFTYAENMFNSKWQKIPSQRVTVKDLRIILKDRSQTVVQPYDNYDKFGLNLDLPHNNNPFMLVRKALHTPRDKWFKYRILHGDIFCMKRIVYNQ